MKILHTSDWHLGHTLYNYDRTAEQQSFLRQLTRIVTEEQPDAMVVSGDIYHYSSPAAATQKMYTDAMLNIHQACPGMAIVVTAGNHDSSSKLEIDSSLWQHFGLNVVGNIERTAEEVNLDKHIIEINNEKKTIGYVIAVPHVYPQNFPLLDTETPRDQRQARFFQALLDEVKKRNTAQLPVVLMAHLSIEGSDRSGHDESIGGIEYVPLSAMGEGYDYLALGHIHTYKREQLDARGIYVYPGCLEGRGFDECGIHGFCLLEVDVAHHKIQDTFVPFASRRLWEASVDVSVCASGVDILDAIKETLQEMQVKTADLVKVCLTGSLPVGVEVDTDLLAMQLSQIYFYAKVVDYTVPEIDYAAYTYDASLKGEFVRLVQAQTDLSDEEKAKIIQTGILALAGEAFI